ncbi:hypothetical protein F8388_006001 [Cannabis sativa]|uniref:Ubiquitin-like protease family profile domain-containing protein n=1 Tax=Cannabis sativa TaxID=3483 RepID=A0A7J6H5I8_CANSA|nr:hypothetical protein F8388_006001 [Cannabis sativa]
MGSFVGLNERKCRLALGSIDHIVAFTLQVETGESTIHTLPLARLYCWVIIKHALNPVALIPKAIPEVEVFTIVQAICVPISWPKNLIIYDDWTDEELLLSNPNQTKKNDKIGQGVICCYLRKHWMCAILVPQAYHVYYLDPLNAPITNRLVILKTIKEAYDTYLMRRSMEIPKNLSIKDLVCPHQPSDVECGYYVMRMLKDLVQSPNRRDYIKKELIDKKPYPKAMIDEMRDMLPHL